MRQGSVDAARHLMTTTRSATTMPAELRNVIDVLGAKENPPQGRVDRP